MQPSRKFTRMILVLAGTMVIVAAALLLTGTLSAYPGSVPGTEITIQAEKTLVTLPGQCTTITWRTDAGQVYLDGKRVAAQDTRQVCPNFGYTPTFWIPDADRLVEVPVGILVWHPALWFALLSLAVICLLVPAIYRAGSASSALRLVGASLLIMMGLGIILSYGYVAVTDMDIFPTAPLIITGENGSQLVTASLSRQWVRSPGQHAELAWEVSEGAVYIEGSRIALSGTRQQSITRGFVAALWAKPVEGYGRSYNLNPEIIFWSSRTFFLLSLALTMITLGLSLWGVKLFDNLLRRLWANPAHPPSSEKPARWAGYTLAAATAPFVIFALVTVFQERLFPGLFYAIIASVVTALSAQSRPQQVIANTLNQRWAIFSPLLWFIFSIVSLDTGMTLVDAPLFWSALQVWHASVFVWLCVWWLILYAVRTLEFTRERLSAWLVITAISVLTAASAWTAVYILDTPGLIDTNWLGEPVDQPDYVKRVYRLGMDSVLYTDYTKDFPFNWREQPFTHPEFFEHQYDRLVIHRPIYFTMTSQVCQLLDVFVSGYASGDRPCSSTTLAVVASQLTNFMMQVLSGILLFELVLAYLHDQRTALFSALLALSSPFVFWALPNAGTEHVELVIMAGTFWLMHRWLVDTTVDRGKLITTGVVLGLFLLTKLNLIFIAFCLMLVVMKRPWRYLLVLPVALLVWLTYSQLVTLFGSPYLVAELNTVASHGNYGWKLLFNFDGFVGGNTLITGISQFAKAVFNRVASAVLLTTRSGLVYYGILLPAGLYTINNHLSFPRWARQAFWGMLFILIGWYFTISWNYYRYVMAQMPFMYAGVMLGIESARQYVHQTTGRKRLASMTSASLIALALINNLLLLAMFWKGELK